MAMEFARKSVSQKELITMKKWAEEMKSGSNVKGGKTGFQWPQEKEEEKKKLLMMFLMLIFMNKIKLKNIKK